MIAQAVRFAPAVATAMPQGVLSDDLLDRPGPLVILVEQEVEDGPVDAALLYDRVRDTLLVRHLAQRLPSSRGPVACKGRRGYERGRELVNVCLGGPQPPAGAVLPGRSEEVVEMQGGESERSRLMSRGI